MVRKVSSLSTLGEIDVLSAAECDEVAEAVLSERDHWTARSPGGLFATLGVNAYMDLAPAADADASYFGPACGSNLMLKHRFAGVHGTTNWGKDNNQFYDVQTGLLVGYRFEDDDTQVRALIASSPLPFSSADTDWILTHSQRWPLLLQVLCRARLIALEVGETDHAWQEDGLHQIEPFRFLLDSP